MHLNQDVFLQTLLYIVHNNDSISNNLPVKSQDEVLKSSKYSTTPVPQEACYGKFGCFNTGSPWFSPPTRAFSYVPEPPHKVNPKYCLRTRFNRDYCQHLDVYDSHSIYKSYLVPKRKHYFIIHGYLENYNRPWMLKMAAELLRVEDVNVIIVDWSGGAMPPYAQATANIRLVGVMTAYLINNMIEEVGIRTEDIHVLGHSLGAHAASYVGHTLRTRFGHTLGRITGLDPAEPFFTDTDPIVRLDPTDAHFVDAIHTDAAPLAAMGMGIRQPVGHVDFYPNGGRNMPGCAQGVSNFITEKDSMIFGLEKYVNCNHVRSNDFFIDSFVEQCPFWGVQCESWEHFKNGSCFSCTNPTSNRVSETHAENVGEIFKGPRCARMGIHALNSIDPNYIRSNKPMKVFLMTNDKSPYCRNMYRLTVTVSNSSKSMTHGGEVGVMSVNIKGTRGETAYIQINPRERFFEPGSVYRQVVSGPAVGSMTSATISWEYETSVNPLTWRLLASPRVFIAKVTIDSLEQNDRMTLSLPTDTPLITRKPLECSRVDIEGTFSSCQIEPLKSL